MIPKVHYLIPLPKPQMGVTHKAACQRAFRFSTGKQLRGVTRRDHLSYVTCEKCLRSGLYVQAAIAAAAEKKGAV